MGRLTDWLEDGRFKSYNGDALKVHLDRVMICGSSYMLKSQKDICEGVEKLKVLTQSQAILLFKKLLMTRVYQIIFSFISLVSSRLRRGKSLLMRSISHCSLVRNTWSWSWSIAM